MALGAGGAPGPQPCSTLDACSLTCVLQASGRRGVAVDMRLKPCVVAEGRHARSGAPCLAWRRRSPRCQGQGGWRRAGPRPSESSGRSRLCWSSGGGEAPVPSPGRPAPVCPRNEPATAECARPRRGRAGHPPSPRSVCPLPAFPVFLSPAPSATCRQVFSKVKRHAPQEGFPLPLPRGSGASRGPLLCSPAPPSSSPTDCPAPACSGPPEAGCLRPYPQLPRTAHLLVGFGQWGAPAGLQREGRGGAVPLCPRPAP